MGRELEGLNHFSPNNGRVCFLLQNVDLTKRWRSVGGLAFTVGLAVWRAGAAFIAWRSRTDVLAEVCFRTPEKTKSASR